MSMPNSDTDESFPDWVIFAAVRENVIQHGSRRGAARVGGIDVRAVATALDTEPNMSPEVGRSCGGGCGGDRGRGRGRT